MHTIRAKEIFKDSTRTIFAVEYVELLQSTTNTHCHLVGTIKPIAVIVQSSEGIYALDMEAKSADLDQLRRDVPDINDYIGFNPNPIEQM